MRVAVRCQSTLLSDSSSDDDDDEEPISAEDLQEMLRLHKYRRRCQQQFYQDPQVGGASVRPARNDGTQRDLFSISLFSLAWVMALC